MKKSVRIIAAAALSAACALGVASLAGCAQKQTVTGEMSYEKYNTEYGIRVNVEVQTDSKGDRIRKVTVAESDYVEASDDMGDWKKSVWENGLDKLLLSYRGEYVADILAKEVLTAADGEPLTTQSNGFVSYGEEFITTGATLGSGRLMLAVQDALKDFGGYSVADGEYAYSNWGTEFGSKVRVVVKDGVIQKVALLSTGLSNASDVETWNKDLWNNNREAVLERYVGKSVEDIKNGTAQVDGQDGATVNSVSDPDLVVTGATLSSARLYKAVQNALSKL